MLFFSLVSIPALFILLNKKLKYEDISKFFLGALISSILSLSMWSLGTLMNSTNMSFVYIVLKFLVTYISPLFVLSIIYLVDYLSKSDIKLPSKSFKSGYVYWNLVFCVIHNSRDMKSVLLPLFYILIVISLYHVDLFKFVAKDDLLKVLYYFLIPFYILIVLLMIYYSILGLVITGIITVVIAFIFKFNTKGLRDKILIFK